MVLLRKAGHWRGQRYQWSRPHDRARAQIRRLRQIVNGQLQVDYASRLQAQDLLFQITDAQNQIAQNHTSEDGK